MHVLLLIFVILQESNHSIHGHAIHRINPYPILILTRFSTRSTEMNEIKKAMPPSFGNFFTAKTFAEGTMSAPKWASVYKNSAVKEREPSTVTSEEILRSESVRFWNRRLSQAEKQAWADVCVPAIERFDSFCDAATIEKDDALEYESKETNHTQENLLQSFSLEPSISFPPELLPCMIVNPPPTCRLDRKAMVQALIQSQKKQSRRAIIHLPRLLPTLRQNFGIMWRQILNQEPSIAIKQFAQKKIGRNKKAQSLQKWILLWASQTESFDQITIFLEVRLSSFD